MEQLIPMNSEHYQKILVIQLYKIQMKIKNLFKIFNKLSSHVCADLTKKMANAQSAYQEQKMVWFWTHLSNFMEEIFNNI